ncbi:TMEM164 family-domain-containing protein [Helicostylum pulchrum]|nr:TMEM164 family-domain-containing protein [Helicostylum pulchrum]
MDKIGRFVESVSYDFKPGSETDFNDGLGGSWYISPTSHGIEFLTVAPFYLIMTAYFGYKAILNNKVNYTLLTENKIRPSRSTFELMCLVTVIASFVVTVIHKVYSKTELFLLQPCHVSAVILIMVMAWPTKFNQFAPQLLFNIYLHTLWGAILALVFPDLRDHDMLGEVFNFFLEHGIILFLPFYMLTTRRYVILPFGFDMVLFSFFLYASYHSPLLHAVSLWSGYNINYTLVPPTLGFLIKAGNWYRFIMYGTAFILMYLTRYILVEPFIRLFVVVQHEKKNKFQLWSPPLLDLSLDSFSNDLMQEFDKTRTGQAHLEKLDNNTTQEQLESLELLPLLYHLLNVKSLFTSNNKKKTFFFLFYRKLIRKSSTFLKKKLSQSGASTTLKRMKIVPSSTTTQKIISNIISRQYPPKPLQYSPVVEPPSDILQTINSDNESTFAASSIHTNTLPRSTRDIAAPAPKIKFS